MPKLLGLMDWILLTAAVSGDIFDQVRLVGELVPSLMKTQYGFVPPKYKKKSYFESVSKLLKINDIKKVVTKNGQVSLELTSVGRSKVVRRFPIFTTKKQDSSFMIVIFDVPESERRARDDLREKLKELGFGKLQESVWVSPYHFEDDLKDFLEENDYINYIFVIRASRVLGISLEAKASEIWPIEKLNSKYKKIIADVGKLKDLEPRTNEIKMIWSRYFEVLSEDPILPKNLLPSDWAQPEAKRVVEELVGSVK